MSQIPFSSVTDLPCTCGYLRRSSRDSRFPVRFDSECNEYYFDHTMPSGTTVSMVLYHCPMCGGVASESQRDKLFATVTDDEARRLNALIHDVRTVQDIERLLGAPDDDETMHPPSDFGVIQPKSGEAETGPIRVLDYTRLSTTADVQFAVYSNGEIKWMIAPKYVGAQKIKEAKLE
jgi:hypothetical protein